MQFLHNVIWLVCPLNNLIFFCLCYQVIIAFGNPEFFNAVFPMLYEMCNTASVKTNSQVQSASDAVKTGCYITNGQSHYSYALIDSTFTSFSWSHWILCLVKIVETFSWVSTNLRLGNLW